MAKNSGYDMEDHDITFAHVTDGVVYAGVNDSQEYMYDVAFNDEYNGNGYYVTRFFVSIGDDLKLYCEIAGGGFIAQAETEEELLNKLVELRARELVDLLSN
jgi:hypothetical protein